MRKRLTLEPQIIDFLNEHGSSKISVLIEFLHQKTGVTEDKIKKRIEKMDRQKKIRILNESINLSPPDQKKQDQDYDEVFNYGPIELARKGNVVSLKSSWEKEEHEKFTNSVKDNLPKLKKELDKKYEELETIIVEKYNPLDVLAYVSANNLFIDPNVDTESSFKGKQFFPEIIQNIILKNEIKKYEYEEKEGISEIEEILDSLVNQFTGYILSETMIRPDLSEIEKVIFVRVMLTFLFIRGEAYPSHHKQISLELFSIINDTLKQKGFTIEEYWSTVEEIKKQIQNNYNEPLKALFDEHPRFKEFVAQEEERGTNPQDIIKKGSFQIQINKKINIKLLDILSMNFGDNEGWNSPLDQNEIPIKPIIKLNDTYYCFLIAHLIRNVIPIIESILTESEKTQLKYSDLKGEFFEEKTLSLLGQLIDGQVYPKLTYPPRTEIDGIIVKNDLVFLVEIKGKKRRIIAGVDDILKLTKEDFEAHINEAFEQTKRALNHIQTNDEAEFRNSQRGVIIKLKKDKIKKIYLVTVSLASFSELSINLIKSWDPQLLEGTDYPWMVNIYDLMVLNEILEKETGAFIKYVDQRIEVAKNDDLTAIDELDFLGYFLEHGHLTKSEDLKSIQSPLIHGYSEKIDYWYSFLSGEVESAEKPVLKK